jgi:hypothetical protein
MPAIPTHAFRMCQHLLHLPCLSGSPYVQQPTLFINTWRSRIHLPSYSYHPHGACPCTPSLLRTTCFAYVMPPAYTTLPATPSLVHTPRLLHTHALTLAILQSYTMQLAYHICLMWNPSVSYIVLAICTMPAAVFVNLIPSTSFFHLLPLPYPMSRTSRFLYIPCFLHMSCVLYYMVSLHHRRLHHRHLHHRHLHHRHLHHRHLRRISLWQSYFLDHQHVIAISIINVVNFCISIIDASLDISIIAISIIANLCCLMTGRLLSPISIAHHFSAYHPPPLSYVGACWLLLNRFCALTHCALASMVVRRCSRWQCIQSIPTYLSLMSACFFYCPSVAYALTI